MTLSHRYSIIAFTLGLFFLIQPIPSWAQVSISGDVDPSPAISPTWVVGGNLTVGNTGVGNMTLGGNASVTSNQTYIGRNSGSTGAVTVNGGNLTTSNQLLVGHLGNGTLEISSTGRAVGQTAVIGNRPGGIGTIRVSGGQLAYSSELFVGQLGVGNLEITGNGSVSDAAGYVGWSDGSVGAVSVSNGRWTSSVLYVGGTGTGTLNLSAGAVSTGEAYIGSYANSTGTVSVSGGELESGDLAVGLSSNSRGVLNLSNGTVSARRVDIGLYSGSSGAVNVSGGNLSIAVNLDVGWSGTGSLNLSNGTVSYGNGFSIGFASGNGTVNVSGGVLMGGGGLGVGGLGTGTLNLTGGSVSNSYGVFLFAGGTLNVGTGTTTGTILAPLVDGGGTLNFNHTGDVAFAPAISGTLRVEKLGDGRTILSRANSYSGGTTVSAGTLQTVHARALGSGALTINGGNLDPVGTLNIDSLTWNGGSIASQVGTATDLVNVAGSLVLNGGGGFVFDAGAGFATQTPYTILSAANLSDSVLSLFSGNSLEGVAPVFTRDGNNLVVIFALSRALDGPLLQNSAPILTPTDGVFTVNGSVRTGSPTQNNTIGALVFSPDSSLEVFNVLTVTTGNFTIASGVATLTGGTVIVPGAFNKIGNGTLNIVSSLQVLGVTEVDNGAFYVNGLLQSLGLNILPNGTLGGNGTILGNVLNSGNVSPGNSPGTLSIIGNFTQASTGALNLELASPTNFDRLLVSGNAALAGTLNATSFGGFAPTYGQQFAFLQAGSITGSFDTITAPSEFRGRFLNSGTTGTLLLAPDTYTRVAITDNQRRVARALDAFIPVATGDRAAVSLALDLQSAAQYPGAFDQIAPTLHETIADITLEQSFAQIQLLNQRMSSVRLGARGFQAIGLNAEPLRHDKDGKSVADPKDLKAQVATFEDPRWSTWVIGSGMFANIRGINQTPNLNFQSGGFLLGSDYAWSENLTTGLYGGYQGTYASYGDSGNARINSALFGAYATYAAGGFYADAVIGGGYSNYKVNRSIEFSTIDRTAASQQNGGQFTTGLNFGYDWKASGFTFGPVLGAQYTLASISPFTETGADALNLRVAQQNANSLRTTLGGRIAYTWNVSEKITIIPEVRAFWQHEFLENPRTIGASLNSGNGPGFNYTTAAPDRDAIFTAAGLTAQFGEAWNASLYYNTSFANETTLIHTISASVGLSF